MELVEFEVRSAVRPLEHVQVASVHSFDWHWESAEPVAMRLGDRTVQAEQSSLRVGPGW